MSNNNVICFPAARLGPRDPPCRRQRADIAAQGKCLAVLQRAGHVVHVGKSGHINSPGSLFIEGTMNAESLFASDEEAKRQTLVRL